MNKISVFALLAAVAFPSFAEEVTATTDVADAPVAEEVVAESPVAEEIVTAPVEEPVFEEKKSSFLHGLQVGVGVSAFSGLNGFVGYANKDFDSFWAKRFGVRFDFGTTAPIETKLNDAINDVVGDDVEIGDNLAVSDFELDAHHYAALVDFYPFGDAWLLGGWRLTGGYYFGELNATAQIAGTIDELGAGSYEFKLGDTQFKYTGNSVHGSAEFDWEYRGPYLGTGFDLGLFAGFKIYLDAGVVFTNKSAQLGLDVPFDNLQMMDGGNWETVQGTALEDVAKKVIEDTLADAQSELDDLKFYPMVKVGFMYRF